MAKLSKADVTEALEKLGAQFNPEATYNTLVAQLKELQEVDPQQVESTDRDESEGEPLEEEPRLESAKVEEAKEEEPRLKSPRSEDLPEADGEEDDYLRKYQVRGNTVPGSKESDPVPGSKAEVMKANLLSQRKVYHSISRDMGEDKTVKQSVCLNGYRLDFPKQAHIYLPEQISKLLAKSQNQTMEALEVGRIDGDTAKEKALL